MKKTVFAVALGIGLCLNLNAQNHTDAIRYSQRAWGGSARTLSMGGAIGAMGSDISVLNINPAGLGLSRKSEFSVSMGFQNNSNDAEYISNFNKDNKFNVTIPNIGFKATNLVRRKGKIVENGWHSFTFGMNVNRVADFNSRTTYAGTNTKNSITDFFANTNNSSNTHPFNYDKNLEPLPYLAYNTYLVDYDENSDAFFSSIGSTSTNLKQYGEKVTKGGMNEYAAAFAANHSDKIILGAGFNVQSIRYGEEKSFREVNIAEDTVADLLSLEYTENLMTTGIGVGANLGIIFKPSNFFRIGISYVSPKVLHLRDKFDMALSSEFEAGAIDPFSGTNKENIREESEEFEYSYKVITPGRVTGSAAVLFNKHGMLTADVEFVDYSAARLDEKKDGDPLFNEDNQDIRNKYREVVNLRLGGELNYGPYRFRAGFAHQPSPFKDKAIASNENLAKKSYSLGIGMADKNYSFDIAFVHSRWSNYTQPYYLDSPENYFVTNNLRSNQIVMSLNLKL